MTTLVVSRIFLYFFNYRFYLSCSVPYLNISILRNPLSESQEIHFYDIFSISLPLWFSNFPSHISLHFPLWCYILLFFCNFSSFRTRVENLVFVLRVMLVLCYWWFQFSNCFLTILGFQDICIFTLCNNLILHVRIPCFFTRYQVLGLFIIELQSIYVIMLAIFSSYILFVFVSRQYHIVLFL